MIEIKGYIRNPRESRYRSLHPVIELPIFLHDRKRVMPVDVQYRTISMDCWSSLEQKRYKIVFPDSEYITIELAKRAEMRAAMDDRMERLQAFTARLMFEKSSGQCGSDTIYNLLAYNGGEIMSLITEKLILQTFQEMLEEMPFDKIRVSALVKRCGINANTFYYHYQDIFELLDAWNSYWIGRTIEEIPVENWIERTKRLLYLCKEHERKINHMLNSLSRERLEQYIFTLSGDYISQMVTRRGKEAGIEPVKIHEVSRFCIYSVTGFFLHFVWSHMKDDIDEMVDRMGDMLDSFIECSFGIESSTRSRNTNDTEMHS